jgi:hypothetical protein
MQEENGTNGMGDFPAFSIPLDPYMGFSGAKAG